MTLTDKVVGSILVSMFVLTLLMFEYYAQLDNDINDTILDDPHFLGVNDTFAEALGDIRGDAEQQRENFEGQTPQAGGDEGFGLLTIPRNIAKFTSLMFSSFSLVTNLLEDVFGVPSLVFNVLGGLLVIVIILLGWRVIKAGGT